MIWGWPQFVVAGVFAVSFGRALALYGQPKCDSYDITDLFIGPAIFIWLLYMGGFFWTPAP